MCQGQQTGSTTKYKLRLADQQGVFAKFELKIFLSYGVLKTGVKL
jgi:hypothetical protein